MNGLKLFLNKKDFTKKNRNEYLKNIAKIDPIKYKKIIRDEMMDEIKVYTSWYYILIILTSLFLIFSIIIHEYWYVLIILSILSLIMSKIFKNNAEIIKLSYDFTMLSTDLFIENLKRDT